MFDVEIEFNDRVHNARIVPVISDTSSSDIVRERTNIDRSPMDVSPSRNEIAVSTKDTLYAKIKSQSKQTDPAVLKNLFLNNVDITKNFESNVNLQVSSIPEPFSGFVEQHFNDFFEAQTKSCEGCISFIQRSSEDTSLPSIKDFKRSYEEQINSMLQENTDSNKVLPLEIAVSDDVLDTSLNDIDQRNIIRQKGISERFVQLKEIIEEICMEKVNIDECLNINADIVIHSEGAYASPERHEKFLKKYSASFR